MTDIEAASPALDQHRHRITLQPGGVGAGLGLCEGKPRLKVYVTHRTPELQKTLDQILSDQLYIIEESGAIHALPTDE